MFSIKISGFKNKAQAETFVHWYEGQGEQDITVWLECRDDIDVKYINTKLSETFPLKWEGDCLQMVVSPS